MRGQAIFHSLFAEHLPQPIKQEGKGRNDLMNARRNELLVHRYLYYGIKMPYAHGLVIKTLSEEFFLCERRITDIIGEMQTLLRALRHEMPSSNELRKRWPHLVW